MPLTTLIKVTPGTLPSPYCYTTAQQLNEDILSLAFWELQSNVGNTFFNWGSTIPSTDNQAFPWLRTGAGSLNGWYEYTANGNWVMANPEAASSPKRVIFVGTDIEVLSYDGGDGTDPDLIGGTGNDFGPMWRIDSSFASKIPMGAGTLPVNGALAVGASLGTETHTLIEAELPPHKHLESAYYGTNHIVYDDSNGVITDLGNDPVIAESGSVQRLKTYTNPGAGIATPISIIPPVFGVYFIKRTSRVFYKA